MPKPGSKAILFDPHVHPAEAGGEGAEGDAAEAGDRHFGAEALRGGEGVDRGREILVGVLFAGDLAADPGQDPREIQIVEPPEPGFLRDGQFQDHSLAARAEDPEEFGETTVAVFEVADAEGAGDGVVGSVGIRQVLRIGHLRPDLEDDSAAGRLLPHLGQHPLRNVHTCHLGSVRCLGSEGDGKVARAAGSVENAHRRGLHHFRNGLASPDSVNSQGQDVIEGVIIPRDRVEHRPDVIFLGHRLRDGIIAAPTPGMAAKNAFETEPEALEGPVFAEGLQGVLRAGRSKPAAARRIRRDADLIETDQAHERGVEYLPGNVTELSHRRQAS